MYQRSQSVTEDRQSWGSGRIIYTDYTAPSPTATRKKLTNPLCSGGGVLVSVVVAVLAAAACDSVVTTFARCHSLPFSVPDHHHGTQRLLFWSGNAARIVLVCCYRSHFKLCDTTIDQNKYFLCQEIDPLRPYTAPSATGSSKQQ